MTVVVYLLCSRYSPCFSASSFTLEGDGADASSLRPCRAPQQSPGCIVAGAHKPSAGGAAGVDGGVNPLKALHGISCPHGRGLQQAPRKWARSSWLGIKRGAPGYHRDQLTH